MVIEDVVAAYSDYLLVKCSENLGGFERRLQADAEAARAEAVVFTYLRDKFDEARVGEDPGVGGVDFICARGGREVAVEVTSLSRATVTEQSGWAEVPDGVHSFGWLSSTLRTKISGKVRQLAGLSMPRLLVVTTEHSAGDVLLGPPAAEELMVGGEAIRVSFSAGDAQSVAHLEESVFFRWKGGEVEAARKSVSALLFVHIVERGLSVVGLLHPCPEAPFPYEVLEEVPFLRLRKWPLRLGEKIDTDWVLRNISPSRVSIRPIVLTEEELRKDKPGF